MASMVLRMVVLLGMLALAIAQVPLNDFGPSSSSDAIATNVNGDDGKLKVDDETSSMPSDMKFGTNNFVVPNGRTGKCAKKCFFQCLPRGLEGTAAFAFCFAPCIVKCRFFAPLNVGGECTRSCAASISTWHQQSGLTSISDTARYVEGFVDSCSQSCSKFEDNLKN